MFWFKHANTRKHISEKSWLSGWTILNTLAHLAHLAQFYFSLIFSAINTYNCFWFDLTERKKNFGDWSQKHGEKWLMLTTFFLTATAAITGTSFLKICKQRMLHLGKRRLTLFADRMKVAWQRAVAAAQEAKERLTVQPRPPEHPAEFTLNTTCVNKWYIIKYVAPSWVHTEYGMREHRIFISKYVAPSWRVSRILCNIFHLSWGRNIQKFWQRENDF